MVEEQSLEQEWQALPPDVASTCRGGRLIDYALLTSDATYFTMELGIIDDAPHNSTLPYPVWGAERPP